MSTRENSFEQPVRTSVDSYFLFNIENDPLRYFEICTIPQQGSTMELVCSCTESEEIKLKSLSFYLTTVGCEIPCFAR